MVVICADDDSFGLDVVADDNAEGIGEEIFGLEILGQFKCRVGDFDLIDAVESVDFDFIAVVAGQDIPAVLEQLDAIGLDWEGVAVGLVEGVIGDVDNAVLLHRLQERRHMVASGGNLVYDDTTFKREVLPDEIADSKRFKHPFFELVLVDVLRIGYVIEIATDLLTVYHDAELFENGVAPAVERGAMERLAVAQIFVALPLLGQVLVGDFPGTADCVNQPCVFLQLVH